MRPSSSDDPPATTVVKRPRVSFLLLLAACFIDGADVQLLPSCFRALESEFGFTPVNLGYLAMAQAFFLASMSPFWGSLADSGMFSKRVLLAGASGSWGVLTILFGCTSNIYSMFILRALIGTCLGCIMPLSQAIIAKQVGPEERGGLFGWAQGAWVMGLSSASLLGTSISTTPFWVSGNIIMGWRVAYLIVGLGSVALSMVIGVFLDEPQQDLNQRLQKMSLLQVLYDLPQRLDRYLRIPSFWVVVLQGLFGTIPWSALSFLSMFFQYGGFEDKKAALLVAVMFFTMGFGVLGGGHLGDFAARCSRYHGRIVVAQVCVLLSIPCMIVLFLFITPSASNFLPYACVLSCVGLFQWLTPAAKRPILCEIVRPSDWGSLLAWDIAFEGASGALFGAPLVGVIAQHAFGYTPSKGMVSAMRPELRQRNQHALAYGLCWMTVLPWVICLLMWTVLHFTYPRDSKAAEESGAEDDVIVSLKDDGCMTVVY